MIPISYSKSLVKEIKQISPTLFEVNGHSVKIQTKKGRNLLICTCCNDTRFCTESPTCSHKLAVIIYLADQNFHKRLDKLIKDYEKYKELKLPVNVDLMINDFVWRAVKDRAMVLFEPDYKRCFVHVRDAARVIIFMMQLSQPSIYGEALIYGEAFNIAPINITKCELCENIKAHTPFVVHEATYETDPDQRDYFVSMDKFYLMSAKHQTRFNFEHSLTSGITELIRGYQALL